MSLKGSSRKRFKEREILAGMPMRSQVGSFLSSVASYHIFLYIPFSGRKMILLGRIHSK